MTKLRICLIFSLLAVFFCFPGATAYAAQSVGRIELAVTAPVVGNTPDTTVTILDGEGFTVVSAAWLPSGHSVFEENTTYTVSIKIALISSDYTYVGLTYGSMLVNGKIATGSSSGSNMTINCGFDAVAPTPTPNDPTPTPTTNAPSVIPEPETTPEPFQPPELPPDILDKDVNLLLWDLYVSSEQANWQLQNIAKKQAELLQQMPKDDPPRPLLSTPFNDYTVTEGFCLLGLLALVIGVLNHFLRRYI